MRNFFALCLLGAFLVCSLLSSCNGTADKQFSSKQDSLSFAQAVMAKYPEANASASADTLSPAGAVKGRTFQTGGMEPVNWATVLLYQSNYDKDPQLKSPQGYYYQGYLIDSAAYQKIIKTPSIKSLYCRLGKKPDGSYTILILGLDANGNVMGGNKANKADGGAAEDTNYDNSQPCPQNCPEEPGN